MLRASAKPGGTKGCIRDTGQTNLWGSAKPHSESAGRSRTSRCPPSDLSLARSCPACAWRSRLRGGPPGISRELLRLCCRPLGRFVAMPPSVALQPFSPIATTSRPKDRRPLLLSPRGHARSEGFLRLTRCLDWMPWWGFRATSSRSQSTIEGIERGSTLRGTVALRARTFGVV